MNEQPHDSELAQRFQSLRKEEARRAPVFEDVVQGKEQGGSGRRSRRLQWATLGSFGVILLVYLGINPTPEPSAPEFWEIPTLEWEWATPTDFLLETPGSALIREVPSLESSLFALKLYADPVETGFSDEPLESPTIP